jgi:hypothetical protein
MDRRNFLRQMAAAPAIFGANALFAQNPPERPLWLSDAFAWMKNENLRGIVVVVPDPAADRAALGKALWQRLNHGGGAVHALFLQGIFIFVREPLAWAHFGRTLQPWDRLILAPDGTRLQQDRVSLKIFQGQETFESSMAPAVFGEDRALLLDRAEKAWGLAPDNVREALAQLRDEDIFVRKRAAEHLSTRLYLALPCLLPLALASADTPERQAARDLVEERYRYFLGIDLNRRGTYEQEELRKLTGEPPFRQLPYGVALPKRIEGGCGSSVEAPPEGEAMPQADRDRLNRTTAMLCGMASMKTPSYSFVTFMAK